MLWWRSWLHFASHQFGSFTKIRADLHHFSTIFGDFQMQFAQFLWFSAPIWIILANHLAFTESISPVPYVYFLLASTEWSFHSGRIQMVHFTPTGMNWSLLTGMEWTIACWLEWSGTFYSPRIDWSISFWPKLNGPYHFGWNEMSISFWFLCHLT